MKIDHVGYAVKRIDRAIKSFETLGFNFDSAADDPDRNVKIVFGEKDGYRIELVQPLSKNEPSPVDSYLGSVGPTPYHFCYSSNRFDADVEELSQKGYKIIKEPQPAVAFRGRRVVFMMNLGIGLIEIVEGDPYSNDQT